MRVRTGHSFRTAVGKIPEVISRLVELGWTDAPITDRASTFGFVEWRRECKRAGLRPVYGVELAVSPDINAKKPSVDYWTFLAVDDLKTINRLLETATDQFRYEPLLSYEQALAAVGVIRVVGHRARLDLIPEGSDVFVGLSPSVSLGYARRVRERGLPWVRVDDNFYPRAGDHGLYETAIFKANTQTYPQYICGDLAWRASLMSGSSDGECNTAIENKNLLLSRCRAELRQGRLYAPDRPMSLLEMCLWGADNVGLDLDGVYMKRLNRELSIISEKEFEDYFYIIADLVGWARDHMLVGPARGSSCGSLVCYLLGITTVDPIKHGLLFERFIDIQRSDLPDIDIDFSYQHRQMVFDRMEKMYGVEHTARLGTVSTFKPISALGETCKSLNIPEWEADGILETLVEHDAGDERASLVLEDTFEQTREGRAFIENYPEARIAARLEGHPRHYSQHAAGMILTAEPVRSFVAIDARTQATHCNKMDAEELNLLKIDCLGLTQLSILEDALEMAGQDRNLLFSIPEDDAQAFDVINTKRWCGIFQFNGRALQSLCQQVPVETLDDIVAITALARPGPLGSGGAQRWANRRSGKSVVSYPHPALEPYLRETLGVLTYQEQVMWIAREVGNMTWEDVTRLRKAISKSQGREAMQKFFDAFLDGARANGVPTEVVESFWTEMVTFGAYAFNKSHAVAYGIVSYWCAYVKAHWPMEFAAATLTHHDDVDKQIALLRELDAEGIGYTPVDAERSTDKWTIGRGGDGFPRLLGPVQGVIGIGPKAVQTIASSRKRGEPLPATIAKKLQDPKTTIDSLWPIRDARVRILPNPADRNILTPDRTLASVGHSEREEEVLVFCVFARITVKNENDDKSIERRGYAIKDGPVTSLNLQLQDDTDIVFGKIDRYDYTVLARDIIARGKPGKCLYAVKGIARGGGFRMIKIVSTRFIGMVS